MALVSIITVNFNQPLATVELLKSLELYYSKADIEVILVDNGSQIGDKDHFEDYLKQIVYIRSEVNLGFAGGNNLGIQHASGEYLFLINNDTEVTEGLIETLVKTMQENAHVGIISPKINYFDDPSIIQYAGFTPMNYCTCRNYCIGQFEVDEGQYSAPPHNTGFIHGAAMMIKRGALKKAGMMSENFFLYYEEMDWCDQIRKAGFEIWINPNVTIYHKESLSVGKNSALKEYFMNRNRILFIRRNALPYQRFIFYLFFLFIVTPRNILKYLRDGNPGFIRVLFMAIRWNMTNRITSSNLGYPFKK